ncbi:ASCH domain-containing protein [Pontibacter mangrovi]|uniref:Uncharacterized protein n=1 Tax=Pontibacter mangrovi TaxID=2589816 RepID=A0A501W1U5_9BACT|nr:hypothetical protein [Pontibacter mangrovi]TPE43953.1 hypothetical protein FJM65_11045 [Pontibacter mangrovi]
MSTQVKERPILFSTEMVQAILEGRKTQTRRILKKDSAEALDRQDKQNQEAMISIASQLCPYGKPGDRLWVRETLYFDTCGNEWCYQADNSPVTTADITSSRKAIPSIHMPKAACRLLLEITNIRVERLKEISQEDAKAEGLRRFAKFGIEEWGGVEPHREVKNHFRWYDKPIEAFKNLWEHINGPLSWKQNPWVWVLEFKVVDGKEVEL